MGFNRAYCAAAVYSVSVVVYFSLVASGGFV
jgi:hypothetical protein